MGNGVRLVVLNVTDENTFKGGISKSGIAWVKYETDIYGYHTKDPKILKEKLKTKSKIIKIDRVGQILFERSNRAKHISISVKPFKGVRVAVPYGVSFDKAKQFAQSKRNWIKKYLYKMRQVEKEYKAFSKKSTEINRAESQTPFQQFLNCEFCAFCSNHD